VQSGEDYLWFKAVSEAWFDKFTAFMTQYELERSVTDHSIFVWCLFAGTIVLLLC